MNQIRAQLDRAVAVSGAAAIVIAGVALVGWGTDTEWLTRPLGGPSTMKVNTALCLGAVGAALVLRSMRRTPRDAFASRTLGAATAMVAGLTLLQYPTGRDFGIDQLFLADHRTVGAAAGRMSVPTAACLLLLGLALSWAISGRGSRRVRTLLAGGSAAVSGAATFGYLFGSKELYQPIGATSIALSTALALLALSAALLFLDPAEPTLELLTGEGPGGTVIRRIIPLLTLVLMAGGWARLEGQRLGWYDSEFGVALMVITLLGVMWIAIGRTAVRLEHAARGQHRAEEKLETATANLDTILDASPTAIYVKDLAGRYLFANRRFTDDFLTHGHDIAGLRDVDVFPATTASQYRAADNAVLTAKAPVETVEVVERGDGSHTYLSVRFPLLGDDGVRAICGISTDITERTQVAQRERDLQARLASSQRLEAVGMLAGGIAHDFNNLLTSILNYGSFVSEALQEEIDRRGTTDDPLVAVIEDVEQINSVARRAAALTHQLLTFSRREVLKLEVLHVNAVVTDMENLLSRTLAEDIDLVTVLAPDLPPTKADRGQIEQVLMNLSVNARDAMPTGGKLRIETAVFDADVDYGADHGIEPGRYVRLSVSDSGSGMSREVASRVFEPFFTTKATGEGTGLGLATVYGIATQAGGDVVIYSEPGLGTTVRVNFPATTEAPVQKTVALSAPAAATGETILLVEDEEMVREPARRILARNGYVVLTAANADEAMKVVRSHADPIDLLLTDVVMPGRSGKELSTDVSALTPATKVLFMSGYSQEIIVHQGVVEEGAHLIEKPFTADTLLHGVRDLLDTVGL